MTFQNPIPGNPGVTVCFNGFHTPSYYREANGSKGCEDSFAASRELALVDHPAAPMGSGTKLDVLA